MKLYIPTCTLNFNNILSTESISPVGFYSQREFGNKRFYSVCANNNDRVILLYTKYPKYSVDDSELENSAMVIEVDSDDYKQGFFERVTELDGGVIVYACYHTIYLNPFHSVLYFTSNTILQGVLVKAEQSLENKFYKLYSANYNIRIKDSLLMEESDRNLFNQEEDGDFVWKPFSVIVDTKPKGISIDEDSIYDRVKGFLYAYIIGANNSVSTEIGKLKALYKTICNTLSAIINSPNHRPTQTQDDILLSAVKEFNKIYESIDDDTIANKNLINSKLEGNCLHLSSEDVKRILLDFNIFDDFCCKLPLKKVYDAFDVYSCIGFASLESYNRVTASMATAIKKLENKESALKEKYSIDSFIQINDNFDVKIIDESYKTDFYEKLICSQIKGEYKYVMQENGLEESLAQAYNGGAILKSMLGEKWEKSLAQQYINALLNYFQENAIFDLFSCGNEVLNSFAIFCQKGDNIDRLEDYLAQVGFSNYKLVYGIYGATRGFASLPKTFTSVLINEDREYYQNFAKSIWKMLNEVDLKDAKLPQQVERGVTNKGTDFNTIRKNIDKITPNIPKQLKVLDAVSNAMRLEDAVQNPKAFMYILDSMSGMKISKVYKSLKDANFTEDATQYTSEQFRERIYSIIGNHVSKAQKEKIDKAIELESKRQDSEAFLKILDNFLKPKDPAYKKIVSLLSETPTSTMHIKPGISVGKIICNSKEYRESSKRLSISKNGRPVNIIDDSEFVMNEVCEKMSFTKKDKDIFIDEFTYIINDHKNQGYNTKAGWVHDQCGNSNSDIIGHFNNNVSKRIRNNNGKYKTMSKKMLDEIVALLNEYYK